MLQFIAIFPLVIGLILAVILGAGYGVHELADWYAGSASSYAGSVWYSFPWSWPGAAIVHNLAINVCGTDHVAAYKQLAEVDLLSPVRIVLAVQGMMAVVVNFFLATAPLVLIAFCIRVARIASPFNSSEGLLAVHKECLHVLVFLGAIGLLPFAGGIKIPPEVSVAWQAIMFLVATGIVLPVAALASSMEAGLPADRKDDASKNA